MNGKMSEAAAAMGLTSLEARDLFYAANRRNHDAYRDGLDGVVGVDLIGYDEAELCNRNHAFRRAMADGPRLRRRLQVLVPADADPSRAGASL